MPVAVLPGLWLGLSEHHLPFGGTISVDYAAYRAILESIVRSLRALGFARLLIVNGHGGNIDPLAVASRELAVAYDFPIVATTPWFLAPAKIAAIFESDTAPKHACEGETSVMMAIAKDIVKSHKLEEAMQQAPARSMRRRASPGSTHSRNARRSQALGETRGPPPPKRARVSLQCRRRHWQKLSATRCYGRAQIRSGGRAVGKRPRPARQSDNTAHSLAQRVEVDQKNYASRGRNAYSCVCSLLLQAQKWRGWACRVLYRNGAPFRTRRRTHTQLKLLVIFSILNGSTAVGADFGLTRGRREFQHASRQRAPFGLGS